ncbi:MAG: glycine cleavage system aminomethyltransferase GcvT [Candidatus Omnitrophota bacterium]|nr:glycine cleavage system aminomethyltransferase GcvT [Candidatus Omnitrophota bacterium]
MLKTPLYETHLAFGAKMAPFGGWMMPIQYQGILAEHAHTRQGVSVFDICHMGEFKLQADPVLSGLDHLITQNIISMPFGSCRYGFMLNEQAGILDDLIVYRINKANWMIVVNAATISGDLAHLKENLSAGCSLENVSDKMAKLDVQGPQSLDVLKKIFGEGIGKLNYYTFSEFIFDQETCIISRTGYTGELGYEIYIANDYVGRLWKLLLKDSRVLPAGLGCRDTLRLEMSYPLYGQDLDINHTPLAAGLEKFVNFSKDFIGRDALVREQKNGPKEHLIYFQADSRRAPRHGFAILDKGRQVGTVTSGSFSPSLGKGIGMGYVAGNYDIGAQLVVKQEATEIPVRIVKKPFLKKTSLYELRINT